jgi:hypothetical protein
MWGRVLFAGLARAVLLFGVAATSALSEKARAAGAAYVVDTADVSEPGACKVESWISTASNHDFFAATTPTCHYATYGAGVDWRTPDNVWTLTAEVFGQLGARQDAIGVTEPRFQVGLRWRPIDDFNVDLIYGRNIYGENANWITLATVVRFHVGK